MDYKEAVDIIENIPQIGKEPGVVRSKRLLSLLGNPDKDLKIIHIAGTNGKGSTCMYITRILRESGYNVGTFTSPHLIKLNERIMVNEQMVDDSEFAEYFSKVWEVVKKDKIPGYFDILLAMAMLIYKDRKVDYVVLETGLGGRLDGSNAVLNKILTVITSISLDHCTLLGDTIRQIAREKAGIIVNNVPVVWDASVREAGDVIENVAVANNAPSYAVEKSQYTIIGVDGKHIDFLVDNRYYKKEVFSINSYGLYQPANATLALTAVNVLMDVPVDIAKKALASFFWMGRMEQIRDNIFVDGAHNPGGIEAFIQSADSIKSQAGKILLFSVVKDKHYEEMIEMLCRSEVFDEFIVTQIEGSRRLDGNVIEAAFKKYTDKPVEVIKDVNQALKSAVAKRKDGILFVAGSLYLAGIIEDLMEV